jgi:drug/metabolite transporter, DME family
VLIGAAGLTAYGLAADHDLFLLDRRAILLVGGVGGMLVALFEVAYQFGIARAGVAGAAALLYTAPVLVTVLAQPLLGERLTWVRLLLAAVVMGGAALTVTGGSADSGGGGTSNLAVGVAGGLLAAVSYAGTTILARFAVPRYGVAKVLFLEIMGGTVVLGMVLPLAGHAPTPPPNATSWIYIGALTLATVWLANFAFFAGVRRIEAAPTAVAATIEPVVGALLALVLLGQQLAVFGWLGLVMVVGGVAGGYWWEAFDD